MAHSGFTPYSHRDFIKQLRQLLQDRYTWDGDGFSILKELIQNANDAGATQLDLGWVPAVGECDAHPLLGGAALFAINDGPFQPSDAKNITRLGSNSKAGEATAAGRFGLGLKSVFHLCEAFFYLASPPQSGQERICQIFNPWSPQPGDESSPYEYWDFETGDPRAKQIDTFICERLGGVLHGSSKFFCLWIPLRDSRLLGGKPSIVPGDFDERRLQTMIGQDALGRRLAELLPFLHSLQTIRIWSPQSRGLVEQLRVQLGNDSRSLPKLPEVEGDQYPQSRQSNINGHVVLQIPQHSEVRCDFVGRENIAQSASLEELWNHTVWPKDESIDPETGNWREHRTKLIPHGAVRIMAAPATGRSGRLSMHWCVFLPLGGNAGEERSEVATTLDSDVSIFLHGYFFVDSGRKRHIRTRFVPEKLQSLDVEHLQQEWNAEVELQAVWPTLLDSLAEFVARLNWDDRQVEELTRSLHRLLDQRGDDALAAIASKKQWLYTLSPAADGQLQGQWSLRSANTSVHEIPGVPRQVRVAALLPGLTNTVSRLLITPARSPRIAAARPSPWSATQLKRIITTVDSEIALASPEALQYLADFLEYCALSEDQRQAAGEAIWPVLKRAFQSATVDLLTIQELKEPLQRVLEFVPVEHRLFLSWAAMDREGAAEAFRLIASDVYDILPIPVSVRPFGGDCRKISSETVIRMLRGIEKLSLKSDLLADIVGDLLNRADKDRQELSKQLATLRLLVVHNGLSKQTERVTWGAFEKQKSKRLAFCDQAGLTKQLQSAIGDAGSVCRIDPAFAEKVLGKEHGVPGCSARECVALLTPDRDGRLPRFAPRQSLSDWPGRVELLTKLIEQSERGNSDDQEKTRDACRFLMHGRIQDAGFNAPLFIAKAGESDPLAEKLARHLLIRRVDPDTRSTEEWRILRADAATWAMESLTVNQRKQLKLVPLNLSEPELIELLQRARPDQLSDFDVTEDKYGKLLEVFTEQHPALVKRLPIHPTIDGRHVAIESNSEKPVYWDGGYRLDGDLQQSAVLLRMHKEEKYRELQSKLADVLGPQQVVELILKTATPEKYWKSILKAIEKSNEPFVEQILQALRRKRWFPTQQGARSGEDLICLTIGNVNGDFSDTFIGEINRIVQDCEAAYVPDWLLDNQLQKAFQANCAVVAMRLQEWKILPNVDESLKRLGLLLGGISENTIGYLSPDRFEEWLLTDWNADLMPVHGVLKGVADRFGMDACYRHVTSDIREPITSFSRLQNILLHLANHHRSSDTRNERDRLWSMFQTYFYFLLSHSECTGTSKLESLLLLSQDGTWQAPAELCLPPASGISRRNVLAEDLATLVRERWPETSSVGSESRPGRSEDSAHPSDSAKLRESEDSVASVEQYFRSWEGNLPNDVVGGFVGLLGGDPRMEALANRYLGKRSLDETRRNLHITPSGIGARPLRMSDQRVQVVLVSEEFTQTNNLLGQQFEAPLVAEIESILVGFGTGRHVQCSDVDGVRTLTIQLRRFDPSMTGLDADASTILLAAAAEILLIEGFELPANEDLHSLVQKTFEDLRESDQLEIRVTQQLILEDAELLLSQLGLQSDSVFGPVLAELTRYKRLRAERDHNQRQFNRRSSWTEREVDEERTTPNQTLRHLLENDCDGQFRVLKAVRQRIQGHNQYNPAAIPFELFQNADDACQERYELFASSIECDSLRFHISSDVMTVQHCGRCVNQVPAGADPRTHKLADDLRKMLTPWLSSKDASDHETTEIQLTGKFGLGFKSVFLVSDRPRILSGRIACEIVGGVFPKHIGVDEQALFDRYLDTLTPDMRREATVIELPLTKVNSTGNVADDEGLPPVSTIVGRFNVLAHVLVVFARQIRKIHVHSDILGRDCSTSWTDTAVPDVPHCFKGTFQPLPNIVPPEDSASRPATKASRVLLMRCTRHSGALLLAQDGRKFVSLPDDMPTLWVTAPTLHCLETGFALNASFSLDPGRAQLGRESPENERIARDLGRELGERLVGLFNHCRQIGWKQFCSDVGFDPTANEYEMWNSLWESLGSSLAGLPTTSDAASLLRQIFWGEEGAALKLYRECPVLPGRLNGASFRNELSTLSQVRFAVKGILANDDGYGLMCVRDWPAFKERLGDGHVISERIASQLRALLDYTPSGVEKVYELTDLLAWEITDQCVAPEDAHRFGEVFVGDALQKCDRGEEERLLKLLRELQFKNRKGEFVPAGKLIIGHQPQGAPSEARSDERKRAMFAPEDRVLSGEYSAVGLAFFEICRERLNAPASELAEWVLRADTEAKREAASIYLADGELGRAVQTEIKLRGGIEGTWLESFTKSDEFREMTPTQQGQLVGLLSDQQGQRVIDAIVKNAEQGSYSTHANPAEALKRVHRWWLEAGDRFIRDYEHRTYPNGGLRHLSGDRDDRFRKDWVVLFLLGQTHTMGRTIAEQHREFLRKCDREGRLDMFASSERDPAQWMSWINEFLDSPQDDAQFLQWMKQFVGIYQVSRHLDIYIHAFEAVEQFERQFTLQEITWLSRSAEFQGGGIDAPQLTRVLGMGQCFVLRELVRKGIITNAKAHQHCYVPVKRVRDLLAYLGCRGLGQTSQKWDLSRDIHRFLCDHLGIEASRFGLAFDIPLQVIAENDELQAELFNTRFPFDDSDDDLWYSSDETAPE